LWLVRSEVHVVARRLGEGLTGRQRTCSEITPCLISVREGAKSMNTQQINAVGVGFFFFGNVIFSIRMLTTAPLIVHIQLPVLGGTQGLRKCKIKKNRDCN